MYPYTVSGILPKVPETATATDLGANFEKSIGTKMNINSIELFFLLLSVFVLTTIGLTVPTRGRLLLKMVSEDVLASSSQTPEKTTYNVPKPKPAYYPHKGSPLYADRELYSAIAEAPKTLVEQHLCAPRSGIAVVIPAKSVFRITTPEGPQVCDLNIWNLHNPRERFWAARTRQLHSAHVSTYDRLWSNLPFLRPLVTITADTLSARHDEWGGRVHDTLGTRCDPYVDKLISGEDNDLHCHSNLTRAILPHGLTEFDVHDVLNVFQVTGLNEYDQYFMEACPATNKDYFELFAEQDLLVAISACPGGDLSQWGWGEDSDNLEGSKMVDCCRPLGIDVYKLDNEEKILEKWEAPKVVNYKGNHGLKGPSNSENRRDVSIEGALDQNI